MTAGRRLRFGVFLTNQHPVGSDLVRAWNEQLAMVRAARDLRFDSVFAGQHYLTSGTAMPQPVPFLARLIPEAGDMQIGMGILLLALHNPVDVAELFATLDIASGGRLVFGVGLGYRAEEYEAFAVDRRTMVRRFEENLQAVRRLWREETVKIDLPWCRVNEVGLTVRPIQQPPPIWIAADGDLAVKRAARLSDAWMINPHATTETIERQLELFRVARAAAGLSPATEQPAVREIFCAGDRQLAIETVQPHLAEKYSVYARWGQDKVLPGDESFDIPFDQLARGRFIVGTPEDCIEQLLPWRDRLGVDYFIFRTHWSGTPTEISIASMKLLAQEVMPALRDD